VRVVVNVWPWPAVLTCCAMGVDSYAYVMREAAMTDSRIRL
jgi:hypothetical protein